MTSRSGRIWSLWDMKEIIARNLLSASVHIERVDALLETWANPPERGPEPGGPLGQSLRTVIAKSYGRIVDAADALGAPVTRQAAERAKKKMLARKTPVSWEELRAINAEISSRLFDEIGETSFYCLAPGAAALYNPKEPLFGDEVAARIPKAADDISEGGKCFATGRYTASVFHLMRAMEAAVQTLSSDLGIGNVEREWGKLLSDIGAKIEAMPRGEERNNWS